MECCFLMMFIFNLFYLFCFLVLYVFSFAYISLVVTKFLSAIRRSSVATRAMSSWKKNYLWNRYHLLLIETFQCRGWNVIVRKRIVIASQTNSFFLLLAAAKSFCNCFVEHRTHIYSTSIPKGN